MKKYKVKNRIDNYEQYIGEEPHSTIFDNYYGYYIYAKNKKKAIKICREGIMEQIRKNNFICLQDSARNILVLEKDGRVREYFYDFIAMEEKDESIEN